MSEHPIQNKTPFPWKKTILFLSIGLVATLIATWFTIDIVGSRSLDRAIEEAHSLGVPESWDVYREGVEIPAEQDLAKHPIVSGPELSSLLGDWYAQAKKATNPRNGFYFEPRIFFAEQGTKLSFAEAIEQYAAERDKHQHDLNRLSEALKRPHLDLGTVEIAGSTESSADWFLLSATAVVSSNLLVEANRPSGELDFTDTKNLVRHALSLTDPPNPPTLIDALIRCAILHHLSSCLSAIPSDRLKDEDLEDISSMVAQLGHRKAFIENLKSEGLFLIKYLPMFDNELDDDVLNWLPKGFVQSWYARLIILNNQKLQLLQNSPTLGHEEYKEMQNFELKQAVGFLGDLQSRIDGLASLTEEQIPKCVNTPLALQTLIAIRRFELAEKRWPKHLDELVPSLLPEVPIDITTNKAMQYSLNPDGLPKLVVGLHGREETWEMLTPAERDRRFQAR